MASRPTCPNNQNCQKAWIRWKNCEQLRLFMVHPPATDWSFPRRHQRTQRKAHYPVQHINAAGSKQKKTSTKNKFIVKFNNGQSYETMMMMMVMMMMVMMMMSSICLKSELKNQMPTSGEGENLCSWEAAYYMIRRPAIQKNMSCNNAIETVCCIQFWFLSCRQGWLARLSCMRVIKCRNSFFINTIKRDNGKTWFLQMSVDLISSYFFKQNIKHYKA